MFTMMTGSVPNVTEQQRLIGANQSLVIIIGTLRGGEIAWESALKNLLDANDADLALLISDNTPAHLKNSSLYRRAKYIWNHTEYKDWGDAVDLIHGKDWRVNVLPYDNGLGGVFSGLPGSKGSGVIIFMLRWFLSQILVKERILEQYDRFVLTRSDHFYLCPADFQDLDLDNYVWLPSTDFTDRHLVVGRKHILAALNILPPILQLNQSMAKNISQNLYNPESVISLRWNQEGLKVKYFPRVLFTSATTGDQTRWQPMTDAIYPEGVYLKYIQEYFIAKDNCLGSSRHHPKFCHTCISGTGRTCGHVATRVYTAIHQHFGIQESTLDSAINYAQLLFPNQCRIPDNTSTVSNITFASNFCPMCLVTKRRNCLDGVLRVVKTRKVSLEKALNTFLGFQQRRVNCQVNQSI
jgi:hypothetical protein